MSGHVRQRMQPITAPVNTVTPIISDSIGGFFATAAGVITIAGTNDDGSVRPIITFTATANTWYYLPFYIGPRGGTITTDIASAGVLAI